MVLCHEASHLFGIKHCVYASCVMNGSNHLEESESRPFASRRVQRGHPGRRPPLRLSRRLASLGDCCLCLSAAPRSHLPREIAPPQ